MTGIKGRVTRLERSYGVQHAADDADARMLHRFEETVRLIPRPLLRSFVGVCRAVQAGEPLTSEQQAILEKAHVLWETGAWPT